MDEEDEEKDENNQRIRIIHRERQHQQVQHQGGIDDSHGMKNTMFLYQLSVIMFSGAATQNTNERSLWGSPSAAVNISNTILLTLLVTVICYNM